MSASFEFLSPDHFTAGAVGQPGQRVFYVQSREKGQVVTLKSEKEQVRALAEYLGSLLARLPGGGAAVPAELSLLEPIEDRKSTRLNSSHLVISYAVFCLKKKKNYKMQV